MHAKRCGRIEVPRRTPGEIDAMAEAGRVSAQALRLALDMIEPGVDTIELDHVVEQFIRDEGGIPSFKGFQGYPASICIEVNDIVVHGIPNEMLTISSGDIVGIDVGAIIDGWHGDNAATKGVGAVAEEAQALIDITDQCLELAIAECVVGRPLKAISIAVQEHAESHGYGVVRELIGHGIGRSMHQPPHIPNYYIPGEFPEHEMVLRPGFVLAIEPMINLGGPEIHVDRDAWTVRTADGSLSAHSEHTIAVTNEGPRVLTPRV